MIRPVQPMNDSVFLNKNNKVDAKDGSSLPSVLVVIVNWNGKDILTECLRSLNDSNYPCDKYSIVVIDNGSIDGSQFAVSKSFPNVKVIANKINLGYVKAVNQGLEYGLNQGVEYIWVFNNDVVVAGDTLRRLVDVAGQDNKFGVIAPVVYEYENPDKIYNIGYRVNFWTGFCIKRQYGRDIFSDPEEKIAKVDTILGCSNLVRSDVIRKTGFFNPAYELYFEEADFNARVWKNGFQVIAVKEAKVWHRNAATMDKFIFRRAYLLLRNHFIYQLLNAHILQMAVFVPFYIFVHVPLFLGRGVIYFIKSKITNCRNLSREDGVSVGN